MQGVEYYAGPKDSLTLKRFAYLHCRIIRISRLTCKAEFGFIGKLRLLTPRSLMQAARLVGAKWEVLLLCGVFTTPSLILCQFPLSKSIRALE
jgi:hypothetical protein